MYHVIANGKSTGSYQVAGVQVHRSLWSRLRNPLRAVTKGSGIQKNAALLFDEFLNLAA